jgi:transcriptional regulator with XRE-family HTH domain
MLPNPHPLRRWRLNNGVTIKELADQVGTHFTTIGRIERGQKKGSDLHLLARIKKVTGISADEFLPIEADVSRETKEGQT